MTSTGPQTTAKPHHHKREVYIDAFRGLMALVMVQGHVCSALLSAAAQADPLYAFQAVFHGSTAPGFLFASGFVAGLPRAAPPSFRASVRRARRLLFVLGVGYFIHLPYFSFWKTLEATAAEKATLFACDALQAIALSQLFVLLLQWLVGRLWPLAGGAAALVVLALSPWVWSSGVATRLPPFLGAFLDVTSGSHFPLFPFAAFVLAGTVAGSTIGRQEPHRRHRRELLWGVGLIVGGWLLSLPLAGHVDFWGPSPAYALVRIGGLVLLLRLVELAADREWLGVAPLALLGHETLQVFVLHLQLVYGGILWPAPLASCAARLGFRETFVVLVVMLPVLFVAAWVWHRFKVHAPHEATLALVFLATWFLFQYFSRPW